jgi:hypothetical protein
VPSEYQPTSQALKSLFKILQRMFLERVMNFSSGAIA